MKACTKSQPFAGDTSLVGAVVDSNPTLGRPQRFSTFFCKKFLQKGEMHCGCIIYRNHAAAAAVVVAFPISIFLSKFAVVAVQNLVDKSMSLSGSLY